MSTTGTSDFPQPTPVPLGPKASEVNSGPIDPALIQQTKNEIRALVQEITALSQSGVGLGEFQEEYLRRVVAALASHGGAIWTPRDDGSLQLDYQINLPEEVVEDASKRRRHNRLLQQVFASHQPTLVPPQSGATGDHEAGNPTDYLLIFACLRVEQETLGVIEIFQRAGGGPTTQRGYLRFLVQMGELASDYLKNRRLRHLADRQSLWEQLEGFTRGVHCGLESQPTAFTIANEGRRLLQCDRVSVALRRGRQLEVTAVSGMDALDRRAAQVRQLGRLATAVAAAGRPLWYSGDHRELPPQIDEPLQAYLDQAHAKLLAVIPLHASATAEEESPRQSTPRPPLGALIVEQFTSRHAADGLAERADIMAAHSASALANALEHESLFLLPLWRALGKAKWVLQARMLPRAASILLVLAAAAAALILIPADFDLAARGTLQPAVRREIFAPLDGVVIEVPVEHEQPVRRGEVLVRLDNNQLELDIADLEGRQRTTQERMLSLTRAQFDQRLTVEQQNQMAGELLELNQRKQSLEAEWSLLQEHRAKLTVRSEMDGEVVTWGVQDVLARRPVNRGQILMTVVDPTSDWELELYLPERRMGHLTEAIRNSPDGVPVIFTLASHPGQEFVGYVVEIHGVAEVRGEEGNTVLLRVALDQSRLPELRGGTTVTARVQCGQRAIGYVVFQELIETVQTKILFWL